MSRGTTTIRKTLRFEAAHRLPNVPAGHKCARLHGHSYYVTVAVTGEVDPVFGWILDFADIEAAWKPLHAILDHHYLNEVPGLENPTAENLARFIHERLVLPAGQVVSITVHETCTSEAVYEVARA